ncbi:hypothetical protein [Paracoccus sp. (in: a-proteobacteria)]|uniref:hypothetical protein n=1 Tax=Paracoccus sp. TaxID=267 RepID=UPI002AFDE028|nr:hypothetical protein [Paracoccus sp. (in: a-proteobacteria)]
MSKADRYISKGGRTADYGKSAFTADLIVASSFLAWAEYDGAYYGGESAKDAFKAMCRMLDMDSVRLRKAVMGAQDREG